MRAIHPDGEGSNPQCGDESWVATVKTTALALVAYEIAPRRRGVTTIIRLIAPIASGPDRHIITTATIIQITISPTENIYISLTYKAHTTLLDKSD